MPDIYTMNYRQQLLKYDKQKERDRPTENQVPKTSKFSGIVSFLLVRG